MFSTLNLTSRHWHILIHPQNSQKLAFVTNSGRYEWWHLPFEIKLGSTLFNRIIKIILNKHKIKF